MPCPYFEPQRVIGDAQDIGGRLPLIDEYDGCCHAKGPAQPVISAVRFTGCNQGNPHSNCPVFPPKQAWRSRRFHLQRKILEKSPFLEVLVLEVESHLPLSSHSVQYQQIDKTLSPQVNDICERAQILALCYSYFKHFPYSDRPESSINQP